MMTDTNEKLQPKNSYGWFSTTKKSISTIYNTIAQAIVDNITIDEGNEKEGEIFTEPVNLTTEEHTSEKMDAVCNEKTIDSLVDTESTVYQTVNKELVDTLMHIDKHNLNNIHLLNDTNDSDKNENNETKLMDDIIHHAEYTTNDIKNEKDSVVDEQLQNIIYNENNYDSSQNDNLGNELNNNVLNNVNDSSNEDDDDDNEKETHCSHNQDRVIRSGDNNYPIKTLCSEEDNRYNILQAKILKQKLKIAASKSNIAGANTLGTIDEYKEYQSTFEQEDTSDFQLVVSKKNKKRNKTKNKVRPKGYVAAESIGASVCQSVDASTREKDIESNNKISSSETEIILSTSHQITENMGSVK
jgi:hypothetical protein